MCASEQSRSSCGDGTKRIQLLRILSFDPGKLNTWWTLYATAKRGGLQLVRSAHLDLHPKEPVQVRLTANLKSTYKLVKKAKPDYVVAERFIQRRSGKGNVAEHINHFLGVLFVVCHKLHVPTIYTTSSVHKTWVKRTFGCDTHTYWSHLNAHQADASSLALWAYVKKINA